MSFDTRDLGVREMSKLDDAKLLYLSLFCRFAHAYLRQKPRRHSNEQTASSLKVIARYGRPGGITNGAIHNASALQSLGYDVERVDVSSAILNPLRRVSCSDGDAFVFHCDGTQFPLYAWALRGNFRNGRMIGYFAWELADPPEHWPRYDDLLDEIWTPSTFSARSLAKRYDCPIRVVPHVVSNDGAPRSWRKGRETLTFLTTADARSSLARENPRAVVAAFRQAFSKETDVALVVKLQINKPNSELKKLISEVGADARIRVIRDTLARSEIDELFAKSHVYVSLHRAEGFGLPLLEARTFGLATIATKWSGNLDFMSAGDSILIPCTLARMWDEGGVYGEVTWADPDVVAAASSMRRFYEHPAYLEKIAQAGWEASRSERQLAGLARALNPMETASG
jgi:glycosyltransferase involved in cell wall biosynthesis